MLPIVCDRERGGGVFLVQRPKLSALAAGAASRSDWQGPYSYLELAPELTVEAAREEKSKMREPPLFMWQLDISICHNWTVGTAVPGRSAIARRYLACGPVRRRAPTAARRPL